MDGSALLREKAAASASSEAVDRSVDSRWTGQQPIDLLPVGEYRDRFQNERGITVRLSRERDAQLTAFGKATLNDRYLLEGESYQDLFARVAAHFADDSAHAQRIYDYVSRLWFIPATLCRPWGDGLPFLPAEAPHPLRERDGEGLEQSNVQADPRTS